MTGEQLLVDAVRSQATVGICCANEKAIFDILFAHGKELLEVGLIEYKESISMSSLSRRNPLVFNDQNVTRVFQQGGKCSLFTENIQPFLGWNFVEHVAENDNVDGLSVEAVSQSS